MFSTALGNLGWDGFWGDSIICADGNRPVRRITALAGWTVAACGTDTTDAGGIGDATETGADCWIWTEMVGGAGDWGDAFCDVDLKTLLKMSRFSRVMSPLVLLLSVIFATFRVPTW